MTGNQSKMNAGAGQSSGPNEGEGSQTGARQYNEATRNFVKSGQVDQKAREAAKAVDGPEGEKLRRAEETGRSHSHGEDPALKR